MTKIGQKLVKIRGQVCQKKWPRGQKIWPKMINWSEKWLQNGYKFGQKWACGQKKWAIGHFLKNIWPQKWAKNGQK